MDKKGLKGDFRQKKYQIFYWRENVREREMERTPTSLYDLRRSVGSEFVGLGTKVHLLNEGYMWIPKKWDFAEDSSEEFGKSKVSGLGSVHGTS